jgi:hypothetical protein
MIRVRAGRIAALALASALVQLSNLSDAQPPKLPDDYVRREPITARGLAPGTRVTEFASSSRTFEVTMRKGDEVASGLTEFAEKYHLTGSYLTGVGALDHVVLGWYDPEKRAYKKNVIDEEVELVSLTGNVVLENGKPFVHAHVVVALKDGTTRGGHLLEARVAVELQVFAVDHDPAPAK